MLMKMVLLLGVKTTLKNCAAMPEWSWQVANDSDSMTLVADAKGDSRAKAVRIEVAPAGRRGIKERMSRCVVVQREWPL